MMLRARSCRIPRSATVVTHCFQSHEIKGRKGEEMASSDSDHDGSAAPQRSRRQMLAGGAAGALGVIGLEALANTPQAQAATGGRAFRGSPDALGATTTTPVTKVSAGDGSIHVAGNRTPPNIKTGTLD